MDAMVAAGEGKREKVWFDDLLAAIQFGLSARTHRKDSMNDVIEMCIAVALKFCWTQEVNFHGVTHTAWSSLRSEVVKHIQEGGGAEKLLSVADDDSDECSGGGSSALIQAAIDASGEIPAQTTLENFGHMNADMVDSLKAFLAKNNPSNPVKLHAAFPEMLAAAWEGCMTVSAAIDVHDVSAQTEAIVKSVRWPLIPSRACQGCACSILVKVSGSLTLKCKH